MRKSTVFFLALSCFLGGYILGGLLGGKGGFKFKQVIGNTVNHNNGLDLQDDEDDDYSGEDDLRKLDEPESNKDLSDILQF